ncbi:MAG: hypothetical protein AAB407_04180 [Patescibacteria group bacterium]
MSRYIAIEQDLNAITEALDFVWKKELRFIFQDTTKISDVIIISYDSKKIYAWARSADDKYLLDVIPHSIKLSNKYQSGWRARLEPKALEKFLPEQWQDNQFSKPKISGSLFTLFIQIQKLKHRRFNPYTSYESYLATIVHEFAHVYYNSHKLWWYSNKAENIIYIQLAQKLYGGNKISKKVSLRVPTQDSTSELFAFCAEYTAASIFWPKHKKNLDKYYTARLDELTMEEKKKNLDVEDSVLDRSHHDLAAVVGRILIDRYPGKWPEVLLKKFEL